MTTAYLVVGDKTGANKIADAKEKGVSCITEDQLKELING